MAHPCNLVPISESYLPSSALLPLWRMPLLSTPVDHPPQLPHPLLHLIPLGRAHFLMDSRDALMDEEHFVLLKIKHSSSNC